MIRKGTINLETERLILRKLQIEDANEAFKNWCSDDEVSKYMTWSTHPTVKDTEEWLKEVEKVYVDNINYEWGIVLKETNELIGSIGAYLKEEFAGRYEIGYAISKKYWRNGYTTEGLKCVMDYLINKEEIKRFIGRHATLNGASGSVMQKVGFRYIKDSWAKKLDKSNVFETKDYYYDVYDNIEKPKKEDAEEIAKLVIDSWQTTYKGLIDENYLNNMNVEEAKNRWEKEIEGNKKILIYKENDKIVGVIKYGESESEKENGEIYVLYVKPEEKRKGIGTKLVKTAKQELLKNNYKNMIVWCLDGNEIGENFYLKSGGDKQENRLYNVNGIDIKENKLLFKLRQEKEDRVILVKPTKEYEKQAIEYKKEHFENGENIIHACSRWDKMDDYDEWIKLVQNNSHKETVDKNWTVDSTFFGIRETDGKIVGMIDIRHELNSDYLRNYAGNIGYRSKAKRKEKRICNENACKSIRILQRRNWTRQGNDRML
ncbi:MAG: GNAT family N-acetyltransferase [Clostridia bacterium]|nr:GNAT family N-acetyltransferase [Clostridia bacterium]